MDAIVNYEKEFNYDELYFTSPSSINGGNYFIKIINNSTPLYVQPPKCVLKSGIMKSGRKMYCDLMFTRTDEKFIEWIENLENICHSKIYENRSKWFESNLEQDDIENSFTSPFKIYKSGTYYILRTTIPTILDKPNIKIYDEDGLERPINDIKANEVVATILEIQGIKCSARSFQLEFLIKQMLTIKPVDIFDNFLLVNKKDVGDTNKEKNDKIVVTPADETPADETPADESPADETSADETSADESPADESPADETPADESPADETPADETPAEETPADESPADDDNLEKKTFNEKEEPSFNIDTKTEKEGDKSNIDNFREIDEVDNNLVEIDIKPTDDDTVFLKERNDVYYKMYRDALQKAKMAKSLALTNYLEAKRIKNTYMLTDLSDDSDIDDSIHSDQDSD